MIRGASVGRSRVGLFVGGISWLVIPTVLGAVALDGNDWVLLLQETGFIPGDDFLIWALLGVGGELRGVVVKANHSL